jgi:hypothetical protein
MDSLVTSTFKSDAESISSVTQGCGALDMNKARTRQRQKRSMVVDELARRVQSSGLAST